MLWITYAGFCLVGIGCFALMTGIVDYNDRKSDLDENLFNVEFCSTLSGSQQDSCSKNAAVGLAYTSEKVNESYRSITFSSIIVASGMALFLTSYVRPSWFKRIARETTNHNRTTIS
jgi:hypothetical protein